MVETRVSIGEILECLKDGPEGFNVDVWWVEYEGGFPPHCVTFDPGSSPHPADVEEAILVAKIRPGNGIEAAMDTDPKTCWEAKLWEWDTKDALRVVAWVWGSPQALEMSNMKVSRVKREPIPDYSEGGLDPSEVAKVIRSGSGDTIVRDKSGRVYNCHPYLQRLGVYPIRWQLDTYEIFQWDLEDIWD